MENLAKTMTKSIGIVSGKGGVGKTTLAVNLAVAFHQLGENTLLVDANLTNPHVGLSLGSGQYPHTLHDVLRGATDHASAVQLHNSGLKIVPGDRKAKQTGLKLELLSRYNHHANVVVYDAPPSVHEHVLNTADQFLIVTNPQPTALADARRLIGELQDRQKIIAGVILNKHAKHPKGITTVERALGMPVVGVIPFDNKFEVATSKRAPYLQLYAKRNAAKAINELASRLLCKPR